MTNVPNTSGPVPDSASFTTAVEQMHTDKESMDEKANACIDRYNEGPGWWAGFLDWFQGFMEKVKEALEALVAALEDIAEYLLQLASPGNPFRMFEMKDAWREVQRALSGQVGVLDPINFMGDDSWTGRSGTRYRAMPSRQASALSGLHPKADAFANHLDEHARGIVFGWLAVAKIIADATITYLQDAADFITADPLDWLDIVNPIVDLVGNVLKNVGELLQWIQNYINESLARMNGLSSSMANLEGSEGGAWPSSSFAV